MRKIKIKSLELVHDQRFAIDQTLINLQSSKKDVQIQETMQKAQDAIDQLQEKANVDTFEELYERQNEAELQNDEISQMMKDFNIDDEEVQEDLNELEALIAEEEMAVEERLGNEMTQKLVIDGREVTPPKGMRKRPRLVDSEDEIEEPQQQEKQIVIS